MAGETTKRIWIEDSTITYQIGDTVCWTLPLAELEIFGEYTDPNGPYVDDYFFVFIIRSHHWNEASFYATGSEEFLKELGNLLGTNLTCGLVSSTDYYSRVIWPPKLEDLQLFEFVPVESKGAGEKLKHKFISEYYFVFTKVVKEYLNGLESNGV